MEQFDRLGNDVLRIILGYVRLGNNGGLLSHPGNPGLDAARLVCRRLRDAVDDIDPVARLRRARRNFLTSSSAASEAARDELSAALSNALSSARAEDHINSTFCESPCSLSASMADDERVSSAMDPHRANVRVLHHVSESSGSGSDREDSTSRTTYAIVVPLSVASGGDRKERKEEEDEDERARKKPREEDREEEEKRSCTGVLLVVHILNATAYSARYQTSATDTALTAWLEAEDQESAKHLRELRAVAAALGLDVLAGEGEGSGEARTASHVVFGGTSTFDEFRSGGVDADFFEALASLLGLPKTAVPDDACFEADPPSRAWSAMQWLSMTAGTSATDLWEFYQLGRVEISESPPPDMSDVTEFPRDPFQAPYLPKSAPVRDWLRSSHVVEALQAAGMEDTKSVLNGLRCADARPRWKRFEDTLVWFAPVLDVDRGFCEELLHSAVLVGWEETRNTSRHDYCSASGVSCVLAVPLGFLTKNTAVGKAWIELRIILLRGCGYEGDDRHTTVEVRASNEEAAALLGEEGRVPVGEWMNLYVRDPNDRRRRLLGHVEDDCDGSAFSTLLLNCLNRSRLSNIGNSKLWSRPALVKFLVALAIMTSSEYAYGVDTYAYHQRVRALEEYVAEHV